MVLECTYKASLGLFGPLWVSLGFSGPLWASLGLSARLRASLGLSGFCMYIPTYVHTCTHYAPSFSRESEYDVLSETGSTRCTNSCDDALVVISTSGPLTCDILLNAPVTLRALAPACEGSSGHFRLPNACYFHPPHLLLHLPATWLFIRPLKNSALA